MDSFAAAKYANYRIWPAACLLTAGGGNPADPYGYHTGRETAEHQGASVKTANMSPSANSLNISSASAGSTMSMSPTGSDLGDEQRTNQRRAQSSPSPGTSITSPVLGLN